MKLRLEVASVTGHQPDPFEQVNRVLSDKMREVIRLNPQSFADVLDMRILTLASETAQELGADFSYIDGDDYTLRFNFATGYWPESWS